VITVPIRAILAFIIFQYTNNILYFIGIELFTTSLSLLLLFRKFNKDEFKLFYHSVNPDFFWDNKMISYGKKMYANAIVHFFSAQSLRIVLSIALPPLKLGVYSILLTITGVAMFLIKNLNQVFAPAIAKLYKEKKDSGFVVLGFPSHDFYQEPSTEKEFAFIFIYTPEGIFKFTVGSLGDGIAMKSELLDAFSNTVA